MWFELGLKGVLAIKEGSQEGRVAYLVMVRVRVRVRVTLALTSSAMTKAASCVRPRMNAKDCISRRCALPRATWLG